MKVKSDAVKRRRVKIRLLIFSVNNNTNPIISVDLHFLRDIRLSSRYLDDLLSRT
jgi:hypothetical protein